MPKKSERPRGMLNMYYKHPINLTVVFSPEILISFFNMKSLSNLFFKSKSIEIKFVRHFILNMMPKISEHLRGMFTHSPDNWELTWAENNFTTPFNPSLLLYSQTSGGWHDCRPHNFPCNAHFFGGASFFKMKCYQTRFRLISIWKTNLIEISS